MVSQCLSLALDTEAEKTSGRSERTRKVIAVRNAAVKDIEALSILNIPRRHRSFSSTTYCNT